MKKWIIYLASGFIAMGFMGIFKNPGVTESERAGLLISTFLSGMGAIILSIDCFQKRKNRKVL